MPRIQCPNGWKRKPTDKDVAWHRKDGADCPVCSKQNATPPVEPTEPKVETPTTPAEPPKVITVKAPLKRILGFGNRETTPEIPTRAPKNAPVEYHVDAKHTVTFANIVYGGIRWAFSRWDDWAETKEAGLKTFVDKHGRLLTLSEIEKQGIELDPEHDFWGKAATAFTRILGARTQTDAHSMITWLEMGTRFGAIVTYGVQHIMDTYKAGEPIRKAKADAKKAHKLEKGSGAAGAGSTGGARSLGEPNMGGGQEGVRPAPVAVPA